MPVLGEIAMEARGRMPTTWKALSEHPGFGDDGLQRRVDAIKSRLFGEVVDHTVERQLYGDLGVQYAGVVLALDLITPGYDHWMNQTVTYGATGKNETKTFTDRAAAILKLRDEILVPEEQLLYPMVQDVLVGVLVPKRQGVLMVSQPSDITSPHVTPDPFTFERPFQAPA